MTTKTELNGVEVKTTDHLGRVFSDFFVAKASDKGPGWYVYGRNAGYGGKLITLVARPDVAARKHPHYNGPVRRGWRTKAEAQAIANKLNASDVKTNPATTATWVVKWYQSPNGRGTPVRVESGYASEARAKQAGEDRSPHNAKSFRVMEAKPLIPRVRINGRNGLRAMQRANAPRVNRAPRRKMESEWTVQGLFERRWEDVHTETTSTLARQALRSYRESDRDHSYRMIHRRVPVAGASVQVQTNPKKKTLYQAIVAAGIEHSNHESDLYVPATPEVGALMRQFGVTGRLFKDNLTKSQWVDIPFAYDPFFERKRQLAAHNKGVNRRSRLDLPARPYRAASKYSVSYYVPAERFWQFALEGSKMEADERAALLRQSGHKVRVRKIPAPRKHSGDAIEGAEKNWRVTLLVDGQRTTVPTAYTETEANDLARRMRHDGRYHARAERIPTVEEAEASIDENDGLTIAERQALHR